MSLVNKDEVIKSIHNHIPNGATISYDCWGHEEIEYDEDSKMLCRSIEKDIMKLPEVKTIDIDKMKRKIGEIIDWLNYNSDYMRYDIYVDLVDMIDNLIEES